MTYYFQLQDYFIIFQFQDFFRVFIVYKQDSLGHLRERQRCETFESLFRPVFVIPLPLFFFFFFFFYVWMQASQWFQGFPLFSSSLLVVSLNGFQGCSLPFSSHSILIYSIFIYLNKLFTLQFYIYFVQIFGLHHKSLPCQERGQTMHIQLSNSMEMQTCKEHNPKGDCKCRELNQRTPPT